MSKTLADAIFEAQLHPKKDAKRAALAGMEGDDLKLLFQALNPYRVFNVTANKTELPESYAADDSIGYSPFLQLLERLHERTITGNAAKAAVTSVLGMYTERTAKALLRVLDKDLKCGATVNTFSEVYPDLAVPKFDLMGAEKMNKDPTKGKVYQWQWPCIGEAKYDGLRAIARVEGLKVTYWSRNGKPHEHLGAFDADLIKLAQAMTHDGHAVFDGESLARSFQESLEARGSDNDEARNALKFYVFDCMTINEWDAQHCPMSQQDRSRLLVDLIAKTSVTSVIKSKFKLLFNMDEAQEFYTEVLQDGLKDDGTQNGLGEGLIIKYTDSLYAWNLGGSRGPEWTKWKPFIDVDLTIDGFELGDAGTKNADKLGRFLMSGQDENGNKIRTKVGGIKVSHVKMKPLLDHIAKETGVQFDKPKLPNFIKNKDQHVRKYMLENFEKEFLGKTAMVEAQELTLARDATEYSLRFPQFVTIRDDK